MVKLFFMKIMKFLGFIKEPVNRCQPNTCDAPVEPIGSHPSTGEMFIDISHHEDCNFEEYEGMDMIFKATEGTTWTDPHFHKYLDGCKKHGIRFGAYHFYSTKKDPIKQAKHFINVVGLETMRTMYHLPVLDYEKQTYQNEDDLINKKTGTLIFARYIFEQTGRKVRFYTYDSMMGRLDLDDRWLENFDLPWVARYWHIKPENVGPWGKMWAWQYSSKATIKGIDGHCDVNYFM